jgi:hypothetical protein
VPTFCRHNRFVADCPICSKGTVLDSARQETARRSSPARRGSSSGRRHGGAAGQVARPSRGPYASVGPYDGAELRLERVPGGLRLAAWRGGQIERVAPVIEAGDLPALLAEAAEKELLAAPLDGAAEQAATPASAVGASPGRSGELRDELRVELLDDDRVRIARWIMRPNRGWQLQEAPVMLPPARFAQALAAFMSGNPTR